MLQFECETTPEQIREAEDRVLALAVDRGADRLRQSRILLVLDELLTNIRKHAYPDAPGRVVIEALPQTGDDDKLLHLRILDWGPPFDPLRDSEHPVLTGDVEDRPAGGLGLYLVHNIVCGLAYSREQEPRPSKGRNQISVSFPLR